VAKVVVVTGASAGVGRATVRAFADRGYDVGLLARGCGGLDAATEEVRAAGRRALALPVDVADFAAVDEAARRFESELGAIDVWVNDAFSGVLAPFWEVRDAASPK
jgi:NAD(P)-dependent dehydrogenase (short-subunit alcohol dehydrogenase family)